MRKMTPEEIREKYRFSIDYLKKIYLEENKTLEELREYLGVKSTITASKILNAYGISTDSNKRRADKARGGMSEDEFKKFLVKEYSINKNSREEIAKRIGTSAAAVGKYLKKYNIKTRSKTDWLAFRGSPNYKGGRSHHNGYIEIKVDGHPSTNARGYVYEHRYVMERQLGRLLRSDEFVHHIDGNKANNDPSNLIVLSNPEHAKLHSLLNAGMSYEEAIKEVRP